MPTREKPISAEVDRLYRDRPDLRPALDFYIFFQKNVETELKSVVRPSIPADPANSRLSVGLPALEVTGAHLDIESAGRFIDRLSGADFPVMDNLLRLVDVFRRRPGDLVEVCGLLTAGDLAALKTWSGKQGVDPDLTAVVVKWSLRPSLLRLREAVEPLVNQADWWEGACPVCGFGPFLARFEKDGGRTLACGLCGQEWRFPRLKCPFCDTDDRDALIYLSSGEDSGYRIDVCRQCNHYIKTVDSRERDEVLPPELEDLLTQHLDLVAQERGYSNS